MQSLHERQTADKNPIVGIVVEFEGGTHKSFSGRDPWALAELIGAGLLGVTPIERPAARWSHYVFKLRRGGLHIDTLDEKHGGAFSGTHARYILRSPVRIVEIERQQDNRVAA